MQGSGEQWFLGISPTTALLIAAMFVVIAIGVALAEPHLIPRALVGRLELASKIRQRLAEGATVSDIVSELGCSVRVVRAIKRRVEIDAARKRGSAGTGPRREAR